MKNRISVNIFYMLFYNGKKSSFPPMSRDKGLVPTHWANTTFQFVLEALIRSMIRSTTNIPYSTMRFVLHRLIVIPYIIFHIEFPMLQFQFKIVLITVKIMFPNNYSLKTSSEI